MDMNKQIVTEEEFVAFIAENMGEFEPEEPETEAADDDEEDDDYVEEYISEDDIARENGFWVDDDGHWRELDEEDDW